MAFFSAFSAPRMKAWLQLFRVPNLLTVPGDPLAAFLVATGGRLDERVIPAIIASLCLYAAGLAMNDLADLEEDRRDRPQRPLPSGRVSKGAAWTAVLVLAGAALAVLGATSQPIGMTIGIALLVHIALYNLLTKRIPVIGALNMGVCRALSLALGAVMVSPPDYHWTSYTGALPGLDALLGVVLWPFSLNAQTQTTVQFGIISGALIGIYIAAVTNLARYETQPTYPKFARLLPLGMLLLGYLALKQVTRPIFIDQSPTLWLVGIVLAGMNTGHLMREPAPPLPPRIGAFIRILPILQAAICLAPAVPTRLGKTPDSLICAVILLGCVPLHAWLGKKFYAS